MAQPEAGEKRCMRMVVFHSNLLLQSQRDYLFFHYFLPSRFFHPLLPELSLLVPLLLFLLFSFLFYPSDGVLLPL